MTWILTLWLLSGATGPVYLEDKEPCEMTAKAVADGQPVFVELDDGSTDLVIRAECKPQVAS